MIDEGYHPMTMYFPLVVHGAMLIEPTKSESKASLDLLHHDAARSRDGGEGGERERFQAAPVHAPRRRLDETRAARQPVLRWTKPPAGELRMKSVLRAHGETYPRKIQAESKFSQIEPNPAKPGQIQPREKLGFPCPNRALSRTCADPPGRFFFCLPGSPASPRTRRTAASAGSLPVFHVCLV